MKIDRCFLEPHARKRRRVRYNPTPQPTHYRSRAGTKISQPSTRSAFTRSRAPQILWTIHHATLSATHHQVIPMHHFGAAGVAEDHQDVGRRAALDLVGIFGVVGDQATAD